MTLTRYTAEVDEVNFFETMEMAVNVEKEVDVLKESVVAAVVVEV